MANIALTAAKIVALNTVVGDFPAAAATSSVIDATETFEYTPTKPGHKIAIFVEVANTHGTVVCKALKGAYWAGKDVSFDAVQNKTSVIVIESANVKNADGKVEIELTPAEGKRLATDHAAKVYALEMLV